MSKKRRDNKGRVLKEGESQREDGKYMYRYTDKVGKRHTIYSWKLSETDPVPHGKRVCKSLREMEKQISRDLYDEINVSEADTVTVDDMFVRFMEIRKDLKETTRCTYNALYETHIRPFIGKTKLKNVKASGIQKMYTKLLETSHLKPSSIQKLHAITYQVFDLGVRDHLIRDNPADDAMKPIRRMTDITQEKRHALTIEEQTRFLSYVGSTKRYCRMLPLFTVLLWTGTRIGEALGLRWCDVDFERNVVRITHTILYKQTESGGYAYRISTPKSISGVREIPMFDVVKEAFLAEKRAQRHRGKPQFTVDGYTDFVFLNSAGKVFTQAFVFDTLRNIVYDYNKEELLASNTDGREPNYLPVFSAHNLRHTFCTRLCENETNLKIIQDIMGHKDIRTTMEIYNEATDAAKQASFESIEQKLSVMIAPIYINLSPDRSGNTTIATL